MKAKRYAITLAVAVTVIPAVWAVVRADDRADKSVPKWAVPVDGKADKSVPKWALPVDGKADKGVSQTKAVPASQAEILRGLQGVHAFVGFLDPKVERLGLTKLRLQADTELQLRQYGIKAFSVQEWLRAPGGPLLFVNVELLGEDGESSGLAVGIDVELREDVYTLRETGHRIAWGQ